MKLFNNAKSPLKFFLMVILFPLALCSVAGCESRTKVEVGENNPLTFKLSGDAYLDWITVYGPTPEKPEGENLSVLWKIVPNKAMLKAEEVTSITYGKVPNGFRQEFPESREPPMLIEGAVYKINAITKSGNHGYATITISNGRILRLDQENIN